VRDAGRKALGLAYRTYADAISTEVISDIVSENPDYAPKPESASLTVLWKPKPAEINMEVKVIEKDPALVLKYGKPYLVTTWDEPDEEPFMSILNACRVTNVDRLIEKKISEKK
jgi:hypothetical protein